MKLSTWLNKIEVMRWMRFVSLGYVALYTVALYTIANRQNNSTYLLVLMLIATVLAAVSISYGLVSWDLVQKERRSAEMGTHGHQISLWLENTCPCLLCENIRFLEKEKEEWENNERKKLRKQSGRIPSLCSECDAETIQYYKNSWNCINCGNFGSMKSRHPHIVAQKYALGEEAPLIDL